LWCAEPIFPLSDYFCFFPSSSFLPFLSSFLLFPFLTSFLLLFLAFSFGFVRLGAVSQRPRSGQENASLLRKGFGGYAFAGAFAFPFVVFAEQGFMFLYLRFDFVEGFFAAGTEVFAGCSGVECSRRESEIQGQCVFLFARQF
jgi:hypothetical protein